MIKLNLKMVALVATMMMSLTAQAKTLDWGGRVIDEKGEPMPYVNVVLLSLPDSAFVQGAMTDMDGVFKIVTDINQGLFKVTSVGYQTLYLNAGEGLTIQMKEDTQLLSEVVVKGQLPKTHVKGDAMRTTVAGTILEKAGTVSDALSKIPSLEAERDGAVKVLGRGEAEVYINGRRVQDVKELSRLRSDQIQHVDVVQNPGARYAASVKAVVRITLKRAQGEGISLQDNLGGIYQYGHTLTNNLDVNYRTGGLDITASLWAGRYGHWKSLQENDLTYYVGPDFYLGRSNQERTSVWKGWSPQLQVNYMVNENHSFGAFYKYDRHPSYDTNGFFYTDSYVNGVYRERSESRISGDDSFRKHIFNAYYNGKVGKLGIDWNVDGLFDKTVEHNSTEELTIDANNVRSSHDVKNGTKSSNNFWATKLIFSYPVWKGNLSVGGEYSYNHRTDAYSFLSAETLPVKATDTKINEKSAAAFVEYGRSFPLSIFNLQSSIFIQVGLRYEHLTNDYFNFGMREDEVCRDYGDWFPTVTLSMPVGKVQLSLSYRKDIERPNYSHLTSSTVYINRYTYQSGNPYLRPTYTHNLSLNAAYKWAGMVVTYSRTKDNVTMATVPFPGTDDPMVSLVRYINGSDDYNQLSLNPYARPTIGCWHPTWFIYAQFQNYKSPCANGSEITLSRPYVNFGWDNTVELPHGWRLSAGMRLSSKGDVNNFRLNRTVFRSDLGVLRDFNLRSLGSLMLDLRCNDVFNTNKNGGIIYGIREITAYNPARRTFVLDLTWKFNEARSKYRGSGAGDKQKARM
ncbi:MAG: TonB-dependent receptor [Prevotella sp.]|nr:TonB-dependent receptor [Prevotella sp.]